MVKINRIYTKSGDQGETGLVGGKRIPKTALRVSVYGEVDELNSLLGLVRTLAEKNGGEKLTATVARIQNELFDIGSILATAPGDSWQGMPMLTPEHISFLENEIDTATEGLPELKSFVLPGGTELNANLHVARAVARRCERSILALKAAESVPHEICIYFNRLSDLLFALARRESFDSKKEEYLWVPGGSLNPK